MTDIQEKVEYLQKKFPKLNILFNPEFLTAAYAREDFAFPDKQILGYTNSKTKKIAEIFVASLFIFHLCNSIIISFLIESF